MTFFRQYFWAALLFSIILVSLVIVLIFIFINICISKRASWYSTKAKPNYSDTTYEKQRHQVYRRDQANEKPPLPPRDQFPPTNSVGQSYKDVSTVPDYVVVEGSTPPSLQQPTFTLPYSTVKTKSQDLDSKNYDDAKIPVDEESEDYDDVEIPADNDTEDYDDVEIPADNDTEDYDDVEIPADNDTEDYDDVG